MSDDRITFRYFEHAGVVNEPWGDCNRYWVGLVPSDASKEQGIEPIEAAFSAYKRNLLLWFWQRDEN
ncbi:MAG: hypothetical protein DHS20C11_06320 [Lysobacteraceae bacterium]|nr:MAG: hypothetical protein DHS20C11_06320 [Xanthomonadaceae bacterium]